MFNSILLMIVFFFKGWGDDPFILLMLFQGMGRWPPFVQLQEREGKTPIREEHSSRRERERRAAGRERYRLKRGHHDRRGGGGEERPHGRLTPLHVRDLADVPRGQVLVEGGGTGEH